MINQLIRLFSVLLLVGLAACSPKVDNRGYTNDAGWKEQIIAGKTTKDEVQAMLGSPSTRSTFGDEAWYYISARKETVAFFPPELVQQNVVKISFDSQGVVSAVNNFDQKDAKDFALVKRTTPTEGQNLGFFEQLLGNVGRFNSPTGSSGNAGHLPGGP